MAADQDSFGRRAYLAHFEASPQLMADYDAWRQQPMTKIMVGVIQELFEPRGLGTGAQMPERALYYAGTVDAAAQLVAVLTRLEDVLAARKQQADFAQLVPLYGADKIVKKERGGDRI